LAEKTQRQKMKKFFGKAKKRDLDQKDFTLALTEVIYLYTISRMDYGSRTPDVT
jgi:hypothetical protein